MNSNPSDSIYNITSPFTILVSKQDKRILSIYKTRTYAKSADPDQTPQNTTSDQGLHCLRTESLLNFELNEMQLFENMLNDIQLISSFN